MEIKHRLQPVAVLAQVLHQLVDAEVDVQLLAKNGRPFGHSLGQELQRLVVASTLAQH